MHLLTRLGAVVFLALLSSCDTSATIVIPTITGEARLQFAPGRVPEQRLRELAKIGPYRQEDFLPPAIEECIYGEAEYKDCGSRKLDAPNFLHNAQVNLTRGQQLLDFFNRLDPPLELEPVRAYVRRQVMFYLCLNGAELAYYHGNDEALKTSCGGIDPSTVCLPWVLQASMTRLLDARHGLAGHTWHNCMNAEFRERLGEYPLQSWRRFLNAFGVREEIVEWPFD